VLPLGLGWFLKDQKITFCFIRKKISYTTFPKIGTSNYSGLTKKATSAVKNVF
jgi:hypothetical protein